MGLVGVVIIYLYCYLIDNYTVMIFITIIVANNYILIGEYII